MLVLNSLQDLPSFQTNFVKTVLHRERVNLTETLRLYFLKIIKFTHFLILDNLLNIENIYLYRVLSLV